VTYLDFQLQRLRIVGGQIVLVVDVIEYVLVVVVAIVDFVALVGAVRVVSFVMEK